MDDRAYKLRVFDKLTTTKANTYSMGYIRHRHILSRNMMTSSNGNIFRVTGHLCGEFIGPGEFPSQRPVTRSFDVFFDLHPNKRLSKDGEASDLRGHLAHYDVTVMVFNWFNRLMGIATIKLGVYHRTASNMVWMKVNGRRGQCHKNADKVPALK